MKILTLALLSFLCISCASNKIEYNKGFYSKTHNDMNPESIKKGDSVKEVWKKMSSDPDITKKVLVGDHFHSEIWIQGANKKKGFTYSIIRTSRGIGKITGIDPIRSINEIISITTKKDPSLRRRVRYIEVNYNKKGFVVSVLEKESSSENIEVVL